MDKNTACADVAGPGSKTVAEALAHYLRDVRYTLRSAFFTLFHVLLLSMGRTANFAAVKDVSDVFVS